MQKIVFLDIDGPVIPGHLSRDENEQIMISLYRSRFDVAAIQRLNLLCESTGARIVTNSMQNYVEFDDGTLRDDLCSWGLDSKHFHFNWRTIFPNVDYSANPNTVKGWGRWLGILDWQQRNGEADWVCFDDRYFTNDPRLVRIKFFDGITDQSVLRAETVFGRAESGFFLND